MNNINIKDIELNIDIIKVLNSVSTKVPFEIDITGKIYVNEIVPLTLPIIYKSTNLEINHSIMDAKTIALNIFAKDYKGEVNGSICKIKPLMAWQQIIGLNQGRMLYFDHHSDGIELFEDKELEDIGWNAVVFDISYREIAEFIESSCEGTILFYDNEIQFNGFVIVNDIKSVRNSVKDFVINKIKELSLNGDIDLENLDEDQEESLNYFGIKV